MDEKQHIIFYLHENKSLPRSYVQLAQNLKKYEIQLVPVRYDQMLFFSKHHRGAHFIYLEDSMEAKNWLRVKALRKIKLWIQAKNIRLHHISSYGELPVLSAFKRIRGYYSKKLPITFDELTIHLAEAYYETYTPVSKWPGGRRGKLPEV